jgi:hypothetical protein
MMRSVEIQLQEISELRVRAKRATLRSQELKLTAQKLIWTCQRQAEITQEKTKDFARRYTAFQRRTGLY